MPLPTFNISFSNILKGSPEDGWLTNKYSPFFNLKLKEPINKVDLGPLRINAKLANIDIDSPIDIDIEESYDGSANLIINDRKNPLKIINSRFYLTDSTHYKIGDRKGNLDTNIYTEENFSVEANLVKSVQSIVSIDFVGLFNGGRMPIGNYTFYIKLADSDGNESDFIAESGKVVCHIGSINQPRYIRGGQLNEDSGKSIKLNIKGLGMAYSYINVYYTRTTGTDKEQITTAYKINNKYKITGINTQITITGYELHESISVDDINVQYMQFDSVKTLENCQNISFAGNIVKKYDLFKYLENLSLFITPELSNPESIGNLDSSYIERNDKINGYEYYNVNNIYYRLGYWDEEIYRLGIVYILNDYSLSPVFNIRGIKELTPLTGSGLDLPKSFNFDGITISNKINVQEDGTIEGTGGLENAKGIFRINFSANSTAGTKEVFSYDGIRPIGIRIKFNSDVVTNKLTGLPAFTRGFFIVRQPRIPTILAQGVGIATTNYGNFPVINIEKKNNINYYMIESFLSKDSKGKPYLKSSEYKLNQDRVTNNALLCPEADLRTEVYNTYFDSAEYTLFRSKYQPSNTNRYFKKNTQNTNQYVLDSLQYDVSQTKISAGLLLIEPEVELTKNNNYRFSSKAGDALVSYKASDVQFGDYADPVNDIADLEKYNYSNSKIRGIFNTYIGVDYKNIEPATYYNIKEKGYDFDTYWKDYFLLRANDSSAFFPISDRIGWNEIDTSAEIVKTKTFYRGDCYINTYTHRMNWNFIDPELPTNTKIVDKYTWYKNWRVVNKASVTVDYSGRVEKEDDKLSYNKLLPVFTYKDSDIVSSLYNDSSIEPPKGIIEPQDKSFKKYSENNGIFGYDKLNRADINAVGLGHWVTFKVCSNVNLGMRDIDMSRPEEEATFNMKRSFYPLQSMEKSITLPESRVINNGISKTTGDKYYFDIGDVPFIRDTFSTRIYYSNILQQSIFVNGNRVFLTKNYQDYSMEYGALVKLVEWYGTLVAIMEHGILLIPVNERALVTNESGGDVYINTDVVLPKNPLVVSNMFGSTWPDSVIKTSRFIYGLDVVAKKIWRTNGKAFELISDLKIQKFLNDNINLKESDVDDRVGITTIKTHYNAAKQDVYFVFKYGVKKWHLCWNEILEKWVTRYSWFPEFSENINNIFYTFANTNVHTAAGNYLYKHGFAGTFNEKGNIEPTKWYEEQHPFEFEFVVADSEGVQKIFDNLKIISNKVEPNSLIFEVTGDGFEWNEQKKDIILLNNMGSEDEEEWLTGFGSPFTTIF